MFWKQKLGKILIVSFVSTMDVLGVNDRKNGMFCIGFYMIIEIVCFVSGFK